MARRRSTRIPTMIDVAKRAGVSQTTVSFVLNDVPTVTIPDETRERIWGAVRELGYRPNAAAQVLRTRRTHTIGFITDEVASTPYAGDIIRGAQDAAWANRKILLIVNTARDDALKEAAIEMMLERQVEGIIYAAMYHRAVHLPPNIREVPTVLLDCFAADRSFPSVVPNEVQGGRDATARLLRSGHRRIGFININRPGSIPAAGGRQDGYKDALAAAGVAYDEALVRYGDGDPPSGYQHTLALMDLAEPPTAIFCCTDRMAMGVYQALGQRGLRIPHDVAVLGFDNQEIIAAFLQPPLTTMQLPHYEMGQWAVRYLVEQGDHGDEVAPLQHVLPCPIVERSSV